ncbi:MAG: site-specific integrase [Candidatus Nezhaarchaeales archaeon]
MRAFEDLERFECVKRMLEDISLLSRSMKTRETYLQAIYYFMKYCGYDDLDKLMEEMREGRVDAGEVYRQYAVKLTSTGFAPKTVSIWLTGLKKLFRSNGVRVEEKVKVKTYVVNESMLPPLELLKNAVKIADIRARTAILVMASSGLRIGELVNLKLKDVEIDSSPAVIRVRGAGAKERKSRVTFMSDEARESLKLYLEKRREMGHKIDGESPVIARDDGGPMTVYNLEKIFHNVFKPFVKKEGKYYSIHPHVLRKWFKTQLISTGVPGPIADRLCGHSRYMAEEYELYTEEQLKKWYLKAMPNLTILSRPSDEDRVRKEIALEAIRRFAEALGIDPLRVKIEKEKELGRRLSLDEEIEALQNEIKKLRRGAGDPKKIICEEELEEYLSRGWDLQAILPSGRILIRKVA